MYYVLGNTHAKTERENFKKTRNINSTSGDHGVTGTYLFLPLKKTWETI